MIHLQMLIADRLVVLISKSHYGKQSSRLVRYEENNNLMQHLAKFIRARTIPENSQLTIESREN